jgi:hypothetical protein
MQLSPILSQNKSNNYNNFMYEIKKFLLLFQMEYPAAEG